MRISLLGLTTVSVIAASAALLNDPVEAAAFPAFGGLKVATDTLALTETAQLYVFGGRRYCWYDDGWNGEGWYWCGYQFRRGFGYGGGLGYRGWRRGGDFRRGDGDFRRREGSGDFRPRGGGGDFQRGGSGGDFRRGVGGGEFRRGPGGSGVGPKGGGDGRAVAPRGGVGGSAVAPKGG